MHFVTYKTEFNNFDIFSPERGIGLLAEKSILEACNDIWQEYKVFNHVIVFNCLSLLYLNVSVYIAGVPIDMILNAYLTCKLKYFMWVTRTLCWILT